MNLFKILSHPYTLMFVFLFILISGEHLGGFYALYIFLGLPHGAVHSLLAVSGIGAMLVSHHLNTKFRIKQVLNLVAVVLLFASVFFFFNNDKARYNWGTFEQGLPMFTLVLASVIGLCFIVGTFWQPTIRAGNKPGFLSKV